MRQHALEQFRRAEFVVIDQRTLLDDGVDLVRIDLTRCRLPWVQLQVMVLAMRAADACGCKPALAFQLVADRGDISGVVKPWSKERLPLVEDRIRDRLKQLSARLGSADWLDGAFSAGDLMMVSVLLRLKSSGMLDEYPNLAAYLARGEARPAYQRAFEAQLAVNTSKKP